MKKIISVLFTLAITITTSVTAFALPQGVVTTTANIGTNTATMVYIDMTTPNRRGEAVISSQIAPAKGQDLIDSVDDGKVVAAMNGGFFNAYYDVASVSYPDNYPRIYGTVISSRKVLNNGNISAPGLVFDINGKPYIGQVDVSSAYVVNGESNSLYSVNNSGSLLYNDSMKVPVYAEKGTTVTYVKNDIVTATVVSEGVNIVVPEDTAIILGNSSLKQGDKITYEFSTTVDGKSVNADTVITCGPRLLKDGINVTKDTNSSYDAKQAADAVHQRSFAAIAPDGRLILGTVVSSPNLIAEYLKSSGVKDAILFDGGASSMLYAEGKGFITPAGRNLANIFVIVDKYSADNTIWANPSQAAIKLNSVLVNAQAYTINDSNYFKLRDIADILKDTNSAFSVGWDSDSGTITIDTATPSENTTDTGYGYVNKNSFSEAVKSSANIKIDGSPVTLEAYNIRGNNYFKLRDIAQYVNAEIQWDDATYSINIVTE